MYYKIIKEKYKDTDELVEYLYNHYYYIVDKIYERNNKKIDRNFIDYKLKEILTQYVCDVDNKVSPSKYIHDIMKRFENSYKHLELRKKEFELIIRAYAGDINARQQIFKNNIDKINKKAEEIYMKYNNKVQTELELDDIKQMMYLDIWIFENRFYDKENKGDYFSVALMNQLNYLCTKLDKYINKKNNISFIDIEKVKYSDSYFINSLENKETLDSISTFLSDKYKFVLGYLRQGYTYEYAASMVGLDRQSVNNIKKKIKKISKENDIKWE